MLLRSKKQTSPPLKLEITESIKALKRNMHVLYSTLKRIYKIQKKNVVLL